MLTNVLNDKVTIQRKISIRTATGQEIEWRNQEVRWARVKALDTKAIALYQQISSVVTHEVVFRRAADLTLGSHRIMWRGKILEPVLPPKELEDATIVAVKEI